MPDKITKLLEAAKPTAVISQYTTGLGVAPEAGHVSLYVDLAAADSHRELEMIERLKQIKDHIREIEYARPTAGILYWYLNIGNAKPQIVQTATIGNIVEGMVAIGLSAEVRIAEYKGSVLIDSCIDQLLDFYGESNP